jgi:inner membrane protein
LDPVAHTFTGAALAAAGLRRATPLATAALLIGANAPDVDVLASFGGEFDAIAFRRGWTHGVLALAVWPFVLTGLLLLWDRFVRQPRTPNVQPARAGPLLALTSLAVLTHPALDWLNNYGVRWLMPFDGRWFYGDALFIIDPWVWLTLGGVLFLKHSGSRLSIASWSAFWILASLLMLATDVVGGSVGNLADQPSLVPLPARVLWIAWLAALVAMRMRFNGVVTDRAAAAAFAIVAIYIGAAVGANAAARGQARAALAAAGIAGVEHVMVAPAAANPFSGEVVAATAASYYTGRWSWFAEPRLQLADETLPRPSGALFEAAARTRDAAQYLSWARFPVMEMEGTAGDGRIVVRFTDARYRTLGQLDGPTVQLDRGLSATPP